MVLTALPDLDSLDAEALKALVLAHRSEIAAHRAEIAAREAESERQRKALCDEIEELRRSSNEQIAYLKLVIEKLRRMMFGAKSEKVVVQLEQLELRLEELESARAEMETAAERVLPAEEAKARPVRSATCASTPRPRAGPMSPWQQGTMSPTSR